MRKIMPIISAALLAAPAVAVPNAAAQQTICIDSGHVDVFYPDYDPTELALELYDDTGSPSVARDPGSVEFRLKPSTKLNVPGDPSYEFLGDPDDDVWLTSMQTGGGRLVLGWETIRLPDNEFVDDEVTLTIDNVVNSNGGHFLVYEQVQSQPHLLLHSDSQWGERSTDVPVDEHADKYFAFTEPGEYDVTITISSALAGGGSADPHQVTYTFVVGATC